MTHGLYYKIFYLQTIFSALVACVSFYRYRERNISTRLIGLLFAVSFFCNTAAYIFVVLKRIDPAIFSNLYTFLLVVIVTILYNHSTQKKYNTTFIACGISFVVLGLTNRFFFQTQEATFNDVASSVLILGYCLVYFYRLVVDLPTANVLRLSMFWFSTSFLVYHSATFFLFAFKDYLIFVLKDDMITYWAFHNIVSIVQHAIVLIGLYFDLKHPTTSWQ